MRTLLFLLQKEFLQIFRNKMLLPFLFIMPIIQLLVLGFAATFEMRNIKMVVVDADRSSVTRQIISKFEGSPFFDVVGIRLSMQAAEDDLKNDVASVIVHFPSNFEQNLYREGKAKVQLLANAINGTVAGLSNAYISSILASYNREIILEQYPQAGKGGSGINVTHSFWFNPKLNYQTYMVPGILVILITTIGLIVAGLNLVSEKESGTIEQINVTPISKAVFIMGKLVPFWIIALGELAFGLIVAKLVYNIPFVGSIPLIFFSAAIYLLVILGLGLFFSTLADTQQQLMFIAFFFIMTFILMSGLFTSAESMPQWAKWLNIVNPVAYFIRIIRMVLLKGSTLADISGILFSLGIYAFVAIFAAVLRYRKVS